MIGSRGRDREVRMANARILLVDDRRDNLVALEAVLQGLPVETVAAESGEDALKQLLLGDFAVILLDVQMPGMNGFETANHIKRRERTRQVPIIFLTAADSDLRLAVRGYAVGAVDYLTKPIDPWVLRAKVGVLVELWDKNRRVRAQAALTAQYERRLAKAAERVERALALLPDLDSDERAKGELRSLLDALSEELQ
jgi:CheY-like chemotaxis protein